jgi:hypothetical protein
MRFTLPHRGQDLRQRFLPAASSKDPPQSKERMRQGMSIAAAAKGGRSSFLHNAAQAVETSRYGSVCRNLILCRSKAAENAAK